MKLLVARVPRAGRYPRWGYLDKYEVNPVLPRAVLTTLCVPLLVLVAASGLKSEGRQTIEPVPPHQIEVRPLPPPALRVEHNGAAVRVRRTASIPTPAIVPVRDELAADIEPFDDARVDGGAPDGPADGGETGAAGAADGVDIQPRVLPGREEFVAFEQAPELVFMEAPEYPDIARDAGVEGLVIVRALVDVGGKVVDAYVYQGVPALDKAAMDAVRSARFKPAVQNQEPVAVWIAVPIDFSLR